MTIAQKNQKITVEFDVLHFGDLVGLGGFKEFHDGDVVARLHVDFDNLFKFSTKFCKNDVNLTI